MKGLLFTYLLTYGGSAVALFNPFYGLLVYVCFAIIKPEALWFWSVPAGNYSRTVAIAMLIGWAARGFGNWRLGRGRWITLAFVAYWLWALLSALFGAEDQQRAFWYIESLGKVLLPFLVGMTTIHTVRELRLLVWTIVLGLGYVAFELNLSYYQGYNRLYFDGFGGMDNNCFAIALVTGIGLSTFLGMTAPRWWQQGLALLMTAFMMNAVFFSDSRGGMLALIITGALSFFFVPKRPVHYVVFALVLVLGFRLMGPGPTERFLTVFADESERDASAQSRVEIWADAWDVMLRYPVLGCGPESWGAIAPQYGWPRGKYIHSLWMQTGAELGFPGLALLAAFYGLTLLGARRLMKARAPSVDPFLRHIGRMVTASLIGFAVAAQFVSLWGLEVPYYIVLIGAAALKMSTQGARSNIAAPYGQFRVVKGTRAPATRSHMNPELGSLPRSAF
jgi:probable O-glycosylation ligase (exosortase A-associated)